MMKQEKVAKKSKGCGTQWRQGSMADGRMWHRLFGPQCVGPRAWYLNGIRIGLEGVDV